ncbi:MAG: hypothetical protein CVU39_20210 [Chloroflexi bacterium HGW-Chloroflexi-10]|nr:MAG: hypothetical protein CVU39_20210 [Chloroflexi bacterium HGW-Chloroflexi-10]
MIEQHYRNTLRKIYARLHDHQINWVVTGSLGMALQGMELEVHDIDIQTDQRGAYKIESVFSEYVVSAVHYAESERIRSHLGALEIDGVKVEIMGDIQKLLSDQIWEEPVPIEQYKHWIQYEGMQVPVLSLEYECQAYLKMGRTEKAERIKKWLEENRF